MIWASVKPPDTNGTFLKRISIKICGLWLLLAALLPGQQQSSCYVVSSDQISGRDLGAVIPEFAVIAPEAKVGFAPSPGAQRVFRAADLKKLAAKYGIETSLSQPVCFEWSLRPLSRERIIAAIQKTLAGRNVTIEIIDQSKSPVPEGEPTFPLQGFTGESESPTIWNGFITYAAGRRYNTWARVRLTVSEKQIISTRPIATGETIELSALKAVDYRGPFRHVASIQDESEVTGKCARWFIPAGMVLAQNMFVPARDVEREQLVTVHTDNGAAHVETQGIADEDGYVGSVIRVRNPKTGRVFRARIENRGVVRVVPGGIVGLVGEDKKS